ncbi:MAG: hypothetical protein IPH60_15140 [Flavobacteriales bacterium]|nr:hypothetical protein [Flavobacteriales bacterium]
MLNQTTVIALCTLLTIHATAQTVQRDFDVAPGIVYATAASDDGSISSSAVCSTPLGHPRPMRP